MKENALNNDFKLKKLDEPQWRAFQVADLFDVKIGKSIDGNKVDKENGRIAYITRRESNNGLDGFIAGDEALLNEVCPVITIGNETAEPFVQEYPFFTGTKVNILIPKDDLSKYALLFIACCLRMHKSKYSYCYTVNSTRLRQQRILLPAGADGQPDYDFMEQYMKQIEAELLRDYLHLRQDIGGISSVALDVNVADDSGDPKTNAMGASGGLEANAADASGDPKVNMAGVGGISDGNTVNPGKTSEANQVDFSEDSDDDREEMTG